ncbi:MAG: hypothetical protein MI921_12540 [Cytophagales bacterium]|nr:hypothetical protein [Cytophagales bacterium]
MNIEIFLGRFHPLIVHLPIGFILLAFLMMLWSKKSDKGSFNQAIRFALLLGAVSAVLAAFLGWLLAADGGYDENTLFWHRWLGVGVAILTTIAWLLHTGIIQSNPWPLSAALWGSVLLIAFTGHFGGVLTHGSNYLVQYAPTFVQQMFSADNSGETEILLPSQPDSIAVFQHLIEPILNSKCAGCHSETKKKGGLVLTSQEGILEGGEEGEVLVAGNAYKSALFERVILPKNSKKFMPPKGEPLTFAEIKLLEWWIDAGASFDEQLTANPLPHDMKALLLRNFQVDVSRKPHYERVQVTQASEAALDKLSAAGFKAISLSADNHFLEVKLVESSISLDQFKSLLEVQEQVTWLDLAGKGITDPMLQVIARLPNLTRLKIEQNAITDKGVQALEKLSHLEYLNLYATEITDKSLASIKEIKTLTHLYLWQTHVSEEAIDALSQERPALVIDKGFEFNNIN